MKNGRAWTAAAMVGAVLLAGCESIAGAIIEVRNVTGADPATVTGEVRYDGPRPGPSSVQIAYLLDDVVVAQRSASPEGVSEANPMEPGVWYRVRHEERAYYPLWNWTLPEDWNGVQFSAQTEAGHVRCGRCGPFRWD